MNKFYNKYRIPSARLQNWNYSWNAAYFVTICTADKECFWGEITNKKMCLSEIGKLAQQYWSEIPNHFPFVLLNTFVVMPNHVHGIIVVDKFDDGRNDGYFCNNVDNCDGNVETRHCLVSTKTTKTMKNTEFTESEMSTNKIKSQPLTIGQKRFQNQGKNTLSSIIGSYKSVVTKHARYVNPNFAWQTRFYDHIIRNDASYQRIKEYIIENPAKWDDDKFYTM